MLGELGYYELVKYLPWSGKAAPTDGEFPPQLELVYSIAFQLLNMVEENAAASMRSLRETSESLTAERGLWGDQIARLQNVGVTSSASANVLGKMCDEPVLTAHPTEAKRLAVLDQHLRALSVARCPRTQR